MSIMSQSSSALSQEQEQPRRGLQRVIQGLFRAGLRDYFLGLCIRRAFSKADVILVTPGFPLPSISNKGGYIEAGYTRYYPGVRIECWKGARIKIGRGTYLNRNTEIVAAQQVTIGEQCKIARDVLIMDTDQHAITGEALIARPVEIGNRVWIGSRAIILKGVHIGDDSIVGAGAIVTKDVPAASIVVGPAARVIKNRHGESE
jgi:acetyltransferase-like isoleucine patch superfamily enzyme